MSGYSCVRHVLCCINLMFWVLGCGLLGVGIWLHLVSEDYSTLVSSYDVLSGNSLMITAGVISLLLGFLGCCGSWFENKCLLRAYFVLVIIVLLLELTVGTLGFIYRKHIGNVLQDELLAGIQMTYTIDDQHGLKGMWDNVQTQFQCCGVRSYEDWFNSAAWPNKNWVPSSCCLPQYSNSTSCGQAMEISYWIHNGCYQKLHSWVMERIYLVGIVCVTFACIQLFGIIAALVIVCTLGRKTL